MLCEWEWQMGSYKQKTRDEISSSGYVVDTLEAGLWSFYNTDNFDDGVILAVNLANDADTVGAVYGQLAGAYYGEDTIRDDLKKQLLKTDLIKGIALKLINV